MVDCMRRGLGKALIAALAAATLTASGAATAQGRGQARGDPARGESKAATCVACHGDASRAPLPGTPLLAAQPAQFLALQLTLAREGLRDIPQMAPVLKGLTDTDIIDIAAHFARLPSAKSDVPADDKLVARGAQLSKQINCASCHAQGYVGVNQMPRLAGQREDYLYATLRAYRDNQRNGVDTSMNAMMYGMAEADLKALAHYFSRY